jgi:hypothetical protein
VKSVKSEISNLPVEKLANCGIQVSETEHACRFMSENRKFAPFSPNAHLIGWDFNAGLASINSAEAVFPDTSIRLYFSNNSVLLIYASGHIRFIPWESYYYFSLLSQGRVPLFSQGDLLIFTDQDVSKKLIENLEQILPSDQEDWWCRSAPVASHTGIWYEASEIMLGGNGRHKAFGRLKYQMPIRKDWRTVQIKTLDEVLVEHFPTDDIHPLIQLVADKYFLITKLPGFSDPAKEMKTQKMIS